MGHTPLPWETLGSAQVVAPDNKSMICEISEPRDYEGYPTAMHVRPKIWNPHFKEACATAEYIVKCVNSHEKLVEACKAAANALERATFVQDRSVNIIKLVCHLYAKELRAALKEEEPCLGTPFNIGIISLPAPPRFLQAVLISNA